MELVRIVLAVLRVLAAVLGIAVLAVIGLGALVPGELAPWVAASWNWAGSASPSGGSRKWESWVTDRVWPLSRTIWSRDPPAACRDSSAYTGAPGASRRTPSSLTASASP